MDQTTSSPPSRNWLSLIIGVAISVASIGFIIWLIDIEELGKSLATANYRLIAL